MWTRPQDKMKTHNPFCLALLFLFLLPLCHAQCPLDVPESQLVNALNSAGLIPEADPSKFTLQGLTYLCFVRSTSDNTQFTQVRVSMLYTYDTATDQSAQATFSVCLFSEFRFNMADVGAVTQDTHYTANITREDCQDCLDTDPLASPTFCRLDDPCDAVPCANGGTCSRTGLTDFSCACDGNWGGTVCDACSLACQNGVLNASSCTCNCADGYSGTSCETCSRTCQNGGTRNDATCMCGCVGGFTGPNCETCDVTCQNGGTFSPGTCSCTCPGSFSGLDCATCPLSCDNGGTVNAGTCTCNCADGYSGTTCATCSRSCLNGGTLDMGACTCGCANSFSGDNCETCPLSCDNGGTVNTGTCTCSCVDGYGGTACGTCSLTCQNGGTLNSGNCTCDCAEGYSGVRCENKQQGNTIGGGGLGVGAIVGIIIAVIVVVVLLIAAIVLIIVVIVRQQDNGPDKGAARNSKPESVELTGEKS